jgi:hypothetical protein
LVKFFFRKGKRRKGMLLGTCSRVVELSLGRRKEQEHAAHFRKREGDKSMQLFWGRVLISLSPCCIYTPLAALLKVDRHLEMWSQDLILFYKRDNQLHAQKRWP